MLNDIQLNVNRFICQGNSASSENMRVGKFAKNPRNYVTK